MRLLLIDTVGQPNLVAFVNTKRDEVRDTLWQADRDEAEHILPAVQEVLGTDEERADGIICVNGPGRFTSTRIGVAVANALSFAWEVKGVGLDRMAFVRHLLREDAREQIVAVRSEKGDYYVSGPSKDGEISIVSHAEELPAGTVLVEEAEFHDLWNKGKTVFFRHMAEEIGRVPEGSIVVPLYARSPNITAMKRL